MKTTIANLALAALSALLLVVCGMVGEMLPDLVQVGASLRCGPTPAALPYPTRLALQAFGGGGGAFAFSLTPFMIVFGGLAVCLRGEARAAAFWRGFVAAWLLALIYLGLYVWALLLPFDLLCAGMDQRPLTWIVPALDGVLLAIIVIAVRRQWGLPS